jgi:hypothetical protein
MPELNPISAGISGLTAGYKIYDSVRKNKAANAIERNTKRPIYNHSSLIDDAYNTAMAEVNNTQGQDLATQQLDSGLYGGIDAVLKSGGKADFGTIYNNYGTQMKGLLATTEKNRDSRIAAANNAAYNLAAAKDAEFQYNQDAPFKDAKQREAQLRGQAAQSLNEGISAIAGGVGNALTENLKPGQYGTTGSVDNTGVNTAPRFANSNPDLIGVDANQFRQQGAGVLPAATAAATGGDMANIDTRTVVGYDTFGDPIYAH